MSRPPLPRQSVIQPLDKPYRFIALTQNQITVVDAQDYEWLKQWIWRAIWNPITKSFYAVRTDENNSHHNIPMAREILGCGPEEKADHINHDTLDNRRENLRKATNSQNASNGRLRSNNTSGFVGVHWDKSINKWVSRIKINGKEVHLGCFIFAKKAAFAYDEAARKLHGEFAHLNFPSSTDQKLPRVDSPAFSNDEDF